MGFCICCFVSFLVCSYLAGEERERELVAFTLFVHLVFFDCYCSVALFRGVVGSSAVRDCGIS